MKIVDPGGGKSILKIDEKGWIEINPKIIKKLNEILSRLDKIELNQYKMEKFIKENM